MSIESPEPGEQKVKRPAARPAEAGAQRSGGGGGGEGGPNDLNLSPGVIAAICGGLLVLVIIVFAVFSGGDDDEGGSSAATTPPATTPTGSPQAPPPAPSTPKPPKTPVGAPDGAPTDDFERADGPVGEPWVTLGDWSVVDGTLRLTKPLEDASQVAVRDMGSGDGTVSALARKPSGGQMLVFRYVNPQNNWRIGPVRSYATWGIFKVVDGKSRLVANTGLASTGDNTTVTVELSGSTIKVSIDGVERVTLEDATHQDATIAGFLGTTNGTRGVWDDFYALPAGGAAPAPTTTAAP